MPEPQAAIRVVTVCRNDLRGLQATVLSVDEQTTTPAGHVIQDGASTDGTMQWLRDLPSQPWRTARSEPDGGIYDAMNRALDGEWDLLVFLNSGDRFAAPDVLERIAASWRESQWTWAIGSARMLRADGALVRVHELRRFGWLRFISGIRSAPHQAVVLTRDLVTAVGAHRTDIGLSADQEFLLRCWLRTPPTRLDLLIADCDASGISGQQPPGAFARQIRAHRRALRRPILGHRLPDAIVTAYAIAWDTAKRRAAIALSAARA